MQDELSGRVCAITGGARGIGRAIAQRLVDEGARVILGDILVDQAKAVAYDMGNRARALQLDVRDWSSVAEFFDAIAHEEGRLDVSVHSAGTNQIAKSVDVTSDMWDDIVATNLSGVMGCCVAAAGVMQRSGGGSIINIASAAGMLPLAGRAPYCASKAAVIALTKVLGAEWARAGIRVNSISPGWIDTDLVRAAIERKTLSEEAIRARVPMDELGDVDDIAETALFLSSPRAAFFTGSNLAPDGGYTATGIR